MKPYLVFMAGQNSVNDLVELIDPIKPYIRGICALLHDCDERSKELDYLTKTNNELGAGNIIIGEYIGDHSHSRNRILKETGLKNGDAIVSIDALERIPEQFAKSFDSFFLQMKKHNLDVLNYYSKPYLILYREDMIYFGTPHESLVAMNIIGKDLNRSELNTNTYPEERTRVNVRPLKRDKNHHINHYVRYLLQPNSNQNMLGLEHRGGSESLLKYEKLREDLVTMLDSCQYPRTIEGVKELLRVSECKTVKDIINQNGWINNFYRFHILNQQVEDTHDWSNIPQF